VSNPDCALYRAFRLTDGGIGQILAPKVVVRGILTVALHGLGRPKGDVEMQMPGAFLLHHSRILKSFRHRTIADVPDYLALARP
jgi:hypothetical protein